MAHRRVVTGVNGSGKSTVVSDDLVERAFDLVHTPGMSNELVWATDDRQSPKAGSSSVAVSYVPSVGESRVMVVQFPPDSVFWSSDFDPVASGGEQAELLPGLAEYFEPEAPGFHRTPTVDYAILLSGKFNSNSTSDTWCD